MRYSSRGKSDGYFATRLTWRVISAPALYACSAKVFGSAKPRMLDFRRIPFVVNLHTGRPEKKGPIGA